MAGLLFLSDSDSHSVQFVIISSISHKNLTPRINTARSEIAKNKTQKKNNIQKSVTCTSQQLHTSHNLPRLIVIYWNGDIISTWPRKKNTKKKKMEEKRTYFFRIVFFFFFAVSGSGTGSGLMHVQIAAITRRLRQRIWLVRTRFAIGHRNCTRWWWW